jgi:hypothetical protein
MKNILFLLILIASVFTSLNTNAQCYTATYGLWPSTAFTPNCNGVFANVTTSGYASEYSIVNLIAGNTYTFRSSVATDYITVDNNGAAPLVGVVGVSTVNGISWTCTASGAYRFYTHTSSSCGASTSLRTRSVRCTGSTPSGPSVNCVNTSSFGSATINATGTLVTISTCSYAGEYSTISGAVNAQTLRFTSSGTGDYITIRSGSPNGAVVAQGASPLQFTNTFTGTLYAHWNTATACGTQNSCRTTTVQCMSCTSTAPDPCASISNLSCGTAASYALAGVAGAWSSFGGPFTTPGDEQVFSFTPTLTGNHTIGVTASSGYVDLFYKANSCSGSTGWTYVDDIIGSASNNVSLTAGVTYYFLLDDEDVNATTGNITVSCPTPASNPCTSIATISGCAASATSFSIGSGNGLWDGYGGPFGVPGQERIYSFTPSVTATYPITIVNNGPSTWVDLFWKQASGGCSSSGWTYVDDVAGTATNNVTFTAGVTYYILLDLEFTTGATGSIQIGCPDSDGDGVADNVDACPTVFGTLSNGCPCIGAAVDGNYNYSSPLAISGTTVGACDNSTLRAGYDMTYAITIPCAGNYTFSTCGGASWDTYLFLSSAVNSGVIASNDDFCSLQSQISANLSAGTYYVTVEAFSSTTTGAFTLNVTGTDTPSGSASSSNVSCNGGSNGSITVSATGGNGLTYSLNGGAAQSSNVFSGLAAGDYSIVVTNCQGNSTTISASINQPSALSAGSTSGAISCFGGTTNVTVSGNGGSVPYSGIGTFNVSAGSYSYTVTDANGCAATTNITVNQPTLLVASATSGSISCFGGTTSITASATGGTPAYTYSLNGGTYQSSATFSNLSAGTYTINAKDKKGCTSSTTVTISQPTLLVASSSSGTITCNGGTTTVTVSSAGGTAPYSGTGNFTVSAGTYSYTVTDANGCTSNTSITVSQPTALVATISSTAPNTTVCNGGTAPLTASVSGGLGTVNYQWQFQDNNGNWVNVSGWSATNVATPFTNSRNASPSATRAYRIVVTSSQNSQCTVTATQLVTVIPDPVFTLTSTNVTCNGLNNGTATAVLTGGLPLNYGYNWFSNDGNSSNNNPTGDGTLSVTGLFPAEWVINTTVSGSSFGCYAQASVFITQPDVLVASSSADEILCNGATVAVSVVAVGGTAPYSGDGEYTVGAGDYEYIVTDANGCTATTTISLSQPTAVSVDAGSDAVVYYGYTPMSCTELSGSGSGGTGSLSYAWSNGTNGTTTTVCPSTTSTYVLTATDENGCTGSDEASVCVVDVICYAGNSNIQKVEVCHNGNSLCINENAVPAHLAQGWTLGSCDEIADCPNSTSSELYRSLNDSEVIINDITIFPNPAEDNITVTVSNFNEMETATYIIMNSMGQEVYRGLINSNETSINVSNLNSGVYYFKSSLQATKPIIFVVR